MPTATRKRSDNLTPAQRSRTMSRVRSEDTGPELMVRRMVHRMGFRFRLHRRDLPGSPDMVLPRLHKVIFIHGCFWHGHDCKAGRKKAKTNARYWADKIGRNKTRDARARKSLSGLGWRSLVIWECELRKPEKVGMKVSRFLRETGHDRSSF
jgi:DNA mismatch endonuclease, patch repair protein